MDDEELLAILADERRRSVGFDNDPELAGDREKALNYFKGVMDDVPNLPNRSAAMSSDLSDAVHTVMPDLIEIFTGGDDVATFVPTGPEDEQSAKQETDYLHQVIFQENNGFLTVTSLLNDALLQKLGVVKWWWKDGEDETETLEGKTQDELALLAHGSEVVSYEQSDEQGPPGPDGQPVPLYDVTVKKTGNGKVMIRAIPPEDFAFATDTVSLQDATYCCARFRPRAQDLIADGVPRDIVDDLPAYGASRDDAINHARDQAGETNRDTAGGLKDLRRVETVEHYVRLEEKGKLQIWRAVTAANETILISKEKVNRIQFAAGTPYIVAHRLIGQSLADLIIEVQRIKTALMRAYLDSVYFALNQRNEVDMSGANEFTISDLLRNEPGVPIRVNRPGTVTPVQAGGAGFNGLDALEYFSTVGEGRTGVVRNAQGLNPDTLHDTAKGALTLMSASAKRVRMIARVIAETCFKDLFLGVHALLREHASQQTVARLRGNWTPIDPTNWGERADMSIEIGVGAGGKELELQQIMAELGVMKEVIALQGGEGPVVTWANLYAQVKRFYEKGGCKSPEAYLTDPSTPQAQAMLQQKAQQPNPEMMKVQAQIQGDQAKAQSQAQIAAMQAQAQAQRDQQSAQHDLQLQAQKNELDMQLAQQKADHDMRLKEQEAQLTADLKQREQEFEFALKTKAQEFQLAQASTKVEGAQFGGEAG